MHPPADAPLPIPALLGPSDPQLSCEECFEQLDHYVELEAGGRDAREALPGMPPHLEGCPACREDHDSLLALVTSELPPPRLSPQ